MTAPDATLFSPIQLDRLTVPNRLWVSPMCQYSVEQMDGVPTRWHQVHYGSFALGGWGLVVTEATAVLPEGRISPFDTGIWNDEQVAAWREVTDFSHAQGVPIGIQLAHAGRKASTDRWWPGVAGRNIPAEEGGWTPVGPTSARWESEEYTTEVTEMSPEQIGEVVEAFGQAARRAEQAGFDVLEVHAAHGYLLHQFYSPLSNTRTDEWGGSFENRVRLLLQVVDAVKQASSLPVMVRISATDWTEGGWSAEDSVALCRLLREHGVALVDVSTGGNNPISIKVGPAYQLPFAEQVRAEAGIPVASVGMISDAEQAEQIVADGRADAVFMGRTALRDPMFALRAAHELGVAATEVNWRPQRWRGAWR
ncbi:NADH:flavin oxidoreductase/NADH oxidase [Luteococcus peritonei]|uniref:NADH:flavin oxidoreductase/NADH oxidase n=1 Tax=Luteococcus peritonei TaxID=88874 RepID=A0ABW4S0A5_9ACTN